MSSWILNANIKNKTLHGTKSLLTQELEYENASEIDPIA